MKNNLTEVKAFDWHVRDEFFPLFDVDQHLMIWENFSTNRFDILRWTPIDPNDRILTKSIQCKETSPHSNVRPTLFPFESRQSNIRHDLRSVRQQYSVCVSCEFSWSFPLRIREAECERRRGRSGWSSYLYWSIVHRTPVWMSGELFSLNDSTWTLTNHRWTEGADRACFECLPGRCRAYLKRRESTSDFLEELFFLGQIEPVFKTFSCLVCLHSGSFFAPVEAWLSGASLLPLLWRVAPVVDKISVRVAPTSSNVCPSVMFRSFSVVVASSRFTLVIDLFTNFCTWGSTSVSLSIFSFRSFSVSYRSHSMRNVLVL